MARTKLQDEQRKAWSNQTVKRKAATQLQLAIRLEAAVCIKPAPCVSSGRIVYRLADWGNCACVTCGDVGDYRQMQGGHFLKGRTNAIIFREQGINPQCVNCNKELNGNESAYRLWMLHVHGDHEVLFWQRRRVGKSKPFPRHELFDRLDEYSRRVKAAQKVLRGS